MPPRNPLFAVLKNTTLRYDPQELAALFARVSASRVNRLAGDLAEYLSTNLPRAFNRRRSLRDYRTNPYVLMTVANIMRLDDARPFADFLFNSKLYMALETSFGKSIESILVRPYPASSPTRWSDAPEAIAEAKGLTGLTREEKARTPLTAVWREIDRSVTVGNTRYLTTIKSGPNTINDTQVQAMTKAIADNHGQWMDQTRDNSPNVERLDIVIGLTYGTPRATNNKDNQILVKLLDLGFREENRNQLPGILVDSATGRVRVYRRIGRDFWAFIGNPAAPEGMEHVFLEILLGLAKALSAKLEVGELEDAVNLRIRDLAAALMDMTLPHASVPDWMRDDFSPNELFWFATALTAFYDSGQ